MLGPLLGALGGLLPKGTSFTHSFVSYTAVFAGKSRRERASTGGGSRVLFKGRRGGDVGKSCFGRSGGGDCVLRPKV